MCVGNPYRLALPVTIYCVATYYKARKKIPMMNLNNAPRRECLCCHMCHSVVPHISVTSFSLAASYLGCPASLVGTAGLIAEGVIVDWVAPLAEFEERGDGLGQLQQEQGDEVVLPAAHDAKVADEICAQVVIDERQLLGDSSKPVLRRPGVERVLLGSGVLNLSCNRLVDGLAAVAARDGKDVAEGADGQQQRRHLQDEPGVVEHGCQRGADAAIDGCASASSGRQQQPASSQGEGADDADQDESGAGSAVAGVALVDEEVLRGAGDVVGRGRRQADLIDAAGGTAVEV